MKIELTEQEVGILDAGLEALNSKGQSRQGSQEIIKLSVKLQKKEKDDDSK